MPRDMNGVEISVGNVVQMDDRIRDHEIVRGVRYEVVGIADYGSLTLSLSGEQWDRRRPDAFYVVEQQGPW